MPYKDLATRRAYQLAWMHKRRQTWLAENGPCLDCGTWDDLEIDHADFKTKVSHRVWSWSLVRMHTELAKCVVRCRSCHIEKTNVSGEHPRGEQKSHKLTEQDVIAIRTARKRGASYRDLADQFGTNADHIGQICRGKIWKHMVC